VAGHFPLRAGPHARRAGRVTWSQAVGKFPARPITELSHRHRQRGGG